MPYSLPLHPGMLRSKRSRQAGALRSLLVPPTHISWRSWMITGGCLAANSRGNLLLPCGCVRALPITPFLAHGDSVSGTIPSVSCLQVRSGVAYCPACRTRRGSSTPRHPATCPSGTISLMMVSPPPFFGRLPDRSGPCWPSCRGCLFYSYHLSPGQSAEGSALLFTRMQGRSTPIQHLGTNTASTCHEIMRSSFLTNERCSRLLYCPIHLWGWSCGSITSTPLLHLRERFPGAAWMCRKMPGWRSWSCRSSRHKRNGC